jgi:hypothetical protein
MSRPYFGRFDLGLAAAHTCISRFAGAKSMASSVAVLRAWSAVTMISTWAGKPAWSTRQPAQRQEGHALVGRVLASSVVATGSSRV